MPCVHPGVITTESVYMQHVVQYDSMWDSGPVVSSLTAGAVMEAQHC